MPQYPDRRGIIPSEEPPPKGQWHCIRRRKAKAPPSHLLQPPPPQLAPSFVQSHTKDKGPWPAWPSAPSSLKALKETAPPPCRPGAAGQGGVGCSAEPGLSGTPNPTHFSLAPPAPRSRIILPPPPDPRSRGATWPGTWGCGRGEKETAWNQSLLPFSFRQQRDQRNLVAGP